MMVTDEMRRLARMAFALEVSQIERDVLLTGLTDDELESILDGVLTAALAPAVFQCEPMDPDEDGWSEWIHPSPGFLMQCCGCDLTHEMEVEVVKANPDTIFNAGETVDAVATFRLRRADGKGK